MKSSNAVSFIACAVLVFLIPASGQSCTTFLLDHGEELIFGRNYDWMVDDGLVVVNKRGVSKTALTTDGNPARWISTYGSVTFNQYGRELPMGGMNETGLVVEVMWLDETEYPGPDSRPAIDNLQWVQYQLDNFSAVEEVIGSDSLVRIAPGAAARIHYLVGDRMGNCASVEFIDSVLVCHTGSTMEVTTLTNDMYEASVAFLKKHKGFGGELPNPGGPGSLERFVRTSKMVAEYDPDKAESAVDYAFDVLTDVSQGEWTKWSIVYDLEDLCIHFRSFANREIRQIDLNALDFSCKIPVKVLDINADGAGDIVGSMVDYTRTLNRNLIGNTFGKTEFLKGVPEEVLDRIAGYPESTECEGQ